MVFVQAVFLVAVVWALGFFKAPRLVWTSVIAIVLFWMTAGGHFSLWALVPLWLIFLACVCIFDIPYLRLRFITPRILRYFQKVLPPLNASEKEALAAGDVWWEGDLFSGNPSWNKLASLDKPHLSAEEQAFLDNQVETLCAMLDEWQIVRAKALPDAVWEYIKKEGFLGLIISKAYGGLGFSPLAHSHIITKIASRSVTAGVTVMVPNALGTGEFISHYGTPEQKGQYLPRLAKGEEIPAFGLTAPEAGSDAASIIDTGIVCYGEYNGKKNVLGLKLNWNKRYITLAPIATLLGVAIKMYDPDHLLGDNEDIGITLCLVPTHLPGVEVGKRHFPGGLGFLNGPTQGKDVFIPLDLIIGGPEMRGKGWRMMMEALAGGRGISLPALSTATAKLCYRMTSAYARVREQFRMPIGQLEGVSVALARIGGFTYMADAARNFTVSSVHGGVKPALAAAITKYHVTEIGRKTVNDAMDIHAGRGVQYGPRNYLAYPYSAVPIAITVEGANILTRNLMIFGQGAMRCHPFIKNELAALTEADPEIQLQQFDAVFCQHIGYILRHVARNVFYGLTAARWISVPGKQKKIRYYYKQLTRMSAALALTTEVVLAVFGGELKRKEALSARLGDVLSYLYLASAVMKHYQDQGQVVEDLPLLCWALEYSLSEIQAAFTGVFHNFRPRWLAQLLQRVIFPWGRAYLPPCDALNQRIATDMMTNSAQRDRVTAYCYASTDANDATGAMEAAWIAAEKAASSREKLSAAIRARQISRQGGLSQQIIAAKDAGILTEDEVHLLQEWAAKQWDAIQVDVFEKDQI